MFACIHFIVSNVVTDLSMFKVEKGGNKMILLAKYKKRLVLCQGLTVQLNFMLKFIGKTNRLLILLFWIILCISDRNLIKF